MCHHIWLQCHHHSYEKQQGMSPTQRRGVPTHSAWRVHLPHHLRLLQGDEVNIFYEDTHLHSHICTMTNAYTLTNALTVLLHTYSPPI